MDMPGATASETIQANEQSRQLSVLRFPEDLGDIHILLDFYDYDYSGALGGVTENPITSVAFPLPTSLLDSSRLEVGGKQIGVMGSLAADAVSGSFNMGQIGNAIQSAGGQIAGVGEKMGAALASGNFSTMMSQVSGAVSGIGKAGMYLLRAGVGSLAPQVDQGLGAALGTAVNPHATLVFDGVDLKIHSFEWQFAPKSESEQRKLDEIINKIQYHIHPEYASPLGDTQTGLSSVDRGLLTYPSLVEVKLIGVGGGFNVMFKTKKMMMVNQFNVDYTPTGNVELNRGGTPVMTRCSMNLVESTIHTRNDYKGVDMTYAGNTGEVNAPVAADAAAPGDTTEGAEVDRSTVSSAASSVTVPNDSALNTTNAVDNGNAFA